MVLLLGLIETAAFAEDFDFLPVAEKVLQKVDVPENYTDFSSYIDVGSSVNHVLSWSGGDTNDGGVITVVTDSKDRIISLSQYKYGKYKGNYRLSKIDYTKACDIAEKYIKKIAPEFAEKLVIFKQPNYIARNSENYSVVFYRYENGLPCYDNYAVVLIDAYTAEVSEYRVVWEDYVRVSPQSKYVSKEQALKSFNREIGIQLAYSKYNDDIKLVYSINADGTEFVNAYSGDVTSTGMPAYASAEKYRKKVYFDNEFYETEGKYEFPAIIAGKLKNSVYLGINSMYDIESNRFLTNSDGKVFAEIVYNCYNDAPAVAILDIETSDLVYFRAQRENTDESKMLTDSVCFKIASAFAYQHIGSAYKKCKWSEKIISEDKNIYRVKFLRNVNGIPYYDNGIIIDVDRANGRVIAVDARIDVNQEFPLSIPDVSYNDAYEVLTEKIGFELQYVPYMTTEGKELRVVYSFAPVYPVHVSGTSGMLCDMNGMVYSKPKDKEYTDIINHSAKEQIETVSLAGIMKYDGESFMPDEKVTAYEFAEIIVKVFGIIPEFDDYERYITHEEAVEKIIEALGYDDIAYYDDVYASLFVDSAFISPERAGCAAIAKGLGIINGNAFLPKEYVTRAYCAELIYNTITEGVENNEN